MNDFEKSLNKLLKEFNFKKVHIAMTRTGHNWFFGLNEDGTELTAIPSVQTMRDLAAMLLRKSYETKEILLNGGMLADATKDEISLTFILEEYAVDLK